MAGGSWPPADGSWHRMKPWREGLYAVAAFTGRAWISAPESVTDAQIEQLGANGFGGAADPRVIAALAGPDGWIDSLTVLLVGRSDHNHRRDESPELIERPDLLDHPRARRAIEMRDEVVVYGTPNLGDASVVTMGLGIAGLDEFSYELDPAARGGGSGITLARAALDLLPHGEAVLASVAPGNAASLRALLAAGFRPIGSIQLYQTAQ